MTASCIIFSSPMSRRPLERVLARQLGFWDACNMKKGGELMSINMLLIDDKEMTMQGSIPVQVLTMLKSILHEGSIYVISGFEVRRSNNRFKLTDFHLLIRFTSTTSLVLKYRNNYLGSILPSPKPIIYCVELVVNDESNILAFVTFDKNNEKLPRMHVAHLATKMVYMNQFQGIDKFIIKLSKSNLIDINYFKIF